MLDDSWGRKSWSANFTDVFPCIELALHDWLFLNGWWSTDDGIYINIILLVFNLLNRFIQITWVKNIFDEKEEKHLTFELKKLSLIDIIEKCIAFRYIKMCLNVRIPILFSKFNPKLL